MIVLVEDYYTVVTNKLDLLDIADSSELSIAT